MWTFLNPMFLWAAVAAIIPLVLHLMQRRRTVRLKISTVRFLKMAQKRSSNRIRMENFLLWLLRTFLMLMLALAFAIPVIRTTGFGKFIGRSRRDVALVLDVSYSMGYDTGRRKVWDAAKEAAIAVIDGLQKGDRVCVFLADEHASALIEQPKAELAEVIGMIRNLEIRTGSSQLHEALLAANTALEKSGPREREIYIITDGQALPWAGFKGPGVTAGGGGSNAPAAAATAPAVSNAPAPAATPAPATPAPAAGSNLAAVAAVTNSTGDWDPRKIDKKTTIFALLAGPPTPENSYPYEMEINPPLLMADTTAKITARIGHTGPSQSLAASLYIDDAEINRRNATMEENGTLSVSYALPTLSVGVHTGRIVTSPDSLTLDDDFHFVMRVHRELPVLCIGSTADSYFLTTALNPGGDSSPMSARRIEIEALSTENLRNYSTIFLCNALPVPGQAMLSLEDYVRSGGVLVIFPGDNAAPKDYEGWSCLPGKAAAIEEPPYEDQVRQLRLQTKQDPLFVGFALPAGAVPTIAIKRCLRWDLSKKIPDTAAVIMGGSDIPFLVSRYYGKGRVLCYAVSADRRWSSLPITSFFLPMLHQVVQFGAGLGNEVPYFWTAPSMILSDMLPDLTEKDTILTPRAEPLNLRPIRKETKVLIEAENVVEQGVYTLVRGGGATKEPCFAVNMVRTESNLQPVDANAIPAMTGIREMRIARDNAELQRLVDEHRRGRPLTETVLWIALILAIAELFLANWISRKRSGLSEHMTVETSGRVAAEMK